MATPEPDLAPVPPLLPVKREWRDAVLEAIGTSEASYSTAHRSAPDPRNRDAGAPAAADGRRGPRAGAVIRALPRTR